MHRRPATPALPRRLDRRTLVSYLLGSLIPLGALAYEVDRAATEAASASTTLLVVSVGLLTLGAFFLLPRQLVRAPGRGDVEQEALAALLHAVDKLSDGKPSDRVAATETILGRAMALAPARLSFFVQVESSGQPVVVASAGLSAAHASDLLDGGLGEQVDVCLAGLTTQAVGVGPALVVPVRTGTEPLGALVVVHRSEQGSFAAKEALALRSLAGLAAIALSNAELRDEQSNFFSHVVELLGTALDTHLGCHVGHGHRVARLANLIARELDYPDAERPALHFAALLHDVGMLRIDRASHDLPRACEPHARHGYEMLRPIRIWESSAPLVLHHHEWWDGSGYPAGLAQRDIPLGSRILSLAEAFDAMTSDDSYKTSLSFEEAIEEIRAGAGTQFDPQVVAAFLRLCSRGVIEPEAVELAALGG